jgi:hypothetical protein
MGPVKGNIGMQGRCVNGDVLDEETRAFYQRALHILTEAEIPFLVGGAYAFTCYTGIERHTKDFDIFVHGRDIQHALEAFSEHACRAELVFPHWLGKAYCGDAFVDLIFSSGNGLAEVDEEWFEHAVDSSVLDIPAKLVPAEEMIWQKAFIMERERFDGADVAHVLRARAEQLDWDRLLTRFGSNWRVLFSHLVLFGFIYPGLRHQIPPRVMTTLMGRLQSELAPADGPDGLCQGTLISREQYLIDVGDWGYADARVQPRGAMSEADTELWTAAIFDDH